MLDQLNFHSALGSDRVTTREDTSLGGRLSQAKIPNKPIIQSVLPNSSAQAVRNNKKSMTAKPMSRSGGASHKRITAFSSMGTL